MHKYKMYATRKKVAVNKGNKEFLLFHLITGKKVKQYQEYNEGGN